MIVLAKPGFKVTYSSAHSSCVSLYRELIKLGVTVLEWTPIRMLFGRYDVLHVHWPDNVLSDRNAIVVIMKLIALFASMLFVRALGRRIVWTSHNLKSHEQLHPHLEVWYWSVFPRLLDAICSPMHWIEDQVRADTRFRMVERVEATPFGSWNGCYPEDEEFTRKLRNRLPATAGGHTVLWFGYIRRYKGIEALIDTFRDSILADCTLLLAGKCIEPQYRHELLERIGGLPNVVPDLDFIPDEHVASYFRVASLCILPFARVTNSGSARLALSFNRHILVPNHSFALEFRKAFGPEWVSVYDATGGLTVSAIRSAFNAAQEGTENVMDWKEYDWGTTARKTLRLFESLV